MNPADYGFVFPVHPRLRPFIELIELLSDAAVEAARRAATKRNPKPIRRYQSRLPGPDTPLWNALVRQVAPMLRKRGSKVRLARLLGISKQRLHICLKARTGSLDAEGTLLLLAWLAAERRGRPLA